VPHDQVLKTPKELLAAAVPEAMPDDAPNENTGDLTAMFDEINNLPADDPLRTAANGNASQPAVPPDTTSAPVASAQTGGGPAGTSRIFNLLPAKVVAAFEANGGTSSAMPGSASGGLTLIRAPAVSPPIQVRANGSVVVDAGRRVVVPSFDGAGLRKVVETAAGLGLRVEPVGSGFAREQVPAAGTRVPPGTQVVVRFMR
jgi:cell division protein FtsI (penicillin-binding protein 3)